MRFDVVTLFPEFFTSPLSQGLIGKALAKKIATVVYTNPRDFTTDKHQRVDDEPYGGGVGMVLKPEPIFAAVESLPQSEPREVILLTPQGEKLTQCHFRRWVNYQQLVLICGAYEGFDERIRYLADREISLGDFVLTSGEIPALAIINGVMRLLPGTVGKAASLESESFSTSLLLEYPQYTRPAEFRGWRVPDILRSGNHQAIAQWRAAQQQQRTQHRRPDLG